MKQIRARPNQQKIYGTKLKSLKLVNGSTNGSSSFLDGQLQNGELYDLWCIDRDISYTFSATYFDYLIFSMDETVRDLTVVPLLKVSNVTQNIFRYFELPKVNWLINTSRSYMNADAFGFGILSRGNVQSAIWVLLNQYPAGTSLSANVHKMVELANDGGVDYVPKVGEKTGIIISNYEKFGEVLKPRTQPYMMMVDTTETVVESRGKILRKGGYGGKYFLVDTSYGEYKSTKLIKGLTYILKKAGSRKVEKIKP